jgi:hypothetical protein
MNNKKKKSNECHFKITLLSFLIDLLPIDIENLDIKLISNFTDIEKILKLEKIDKFKNMYFSERIIEQILYDLEKVIYIDDEYVNYFKEFENWFYLDLLIMSNPTIINYNISKSFISKIAKIDKISKYKLFFIITNKITIDLINNYKSSDSYNESNDERELDNIETNCQKNIKIKINELEKIGISYKEDEIYNLRVDEIYADILNSLIKSKKFRDYTYIYDIIVDLNLEKIYITRIIFDELSKTLNMDEDYIKPYIVTKIDDLFNIEIINFYYLLIRYIFKLSFYIYQIPLLLNIRNIIIFIIKNNLDSLIYLKLQHENNYILIERLDYLIKAITDTEYYYMKYINHFMISKLKAVLFFYKFFFFESNKTEIKTEIKEIEMIIANKSKDDYNHLMNRKDVMEKIEIRLEIINNIYEKKINFGDLFLNQNKIKVILNKWKIIENIVREKKLKRLKKDIRIKLFHLFEDQNNLNSLKKIFKIEQINFFLTETQNMPKIYSNIHLNIKNQGENSKLIAIAMDSVNVVHLDNKMENSSIMVQSYTVSSISGSMSQSQSKYNNEVSIIQKVEKNFIPLSFTEKFKKSHAYSIIDHCDIIGKHESAEFIKQLSNGGFISGGNGKYLIWYDKLFRQIENFFVKEYQVNMYEIGESISEEDEINIISLSDNKINYIKLNQNQKEMKLKGKLSNSSIMSVYYLNSERSLILTKDKIGKCQNKWNKYTSNIEKIKDIDHFYRGGMLIKNEIEKIFVLTSNDIIPNGINEMIFFNYSKKEIEGKIDGYSFVSSYHNLCEINQTILFNKKLLLAACSKKEEDENKNGILVVNLELNEKLKYSTSFKETKNFEVYCFCQILNVDNSNPIYGDITNKVNIIIEDTEYFLVGGFSNDKGEGCIKLYKIQLDSSKQNLEIKFIQDIYVEIGENFNGFGGKISSIIQSKITGNILATCWDGNVHLFKPPNIDYYRNK